MNKRKAIYAIIIATVIGGGLGVFGKIGLRVIPPFTFTFFRFLIGILFLTPYIFKLRNLSFKKFIKLFLISLLSSANIFLFSFGIQMTTASIAQLLYAFVPVFVSILSVLILKTKPNKFQIIGIMLGIVGIIILILKPALDLHKGIPLNAKGNILIMIGTICYALYLIYSKKLHKQYSSSVITGAFVGTTVITSLFFAIFENQVHMNWLINIQPITIISLLYVGVFGTGIYYFLNQYVVKNGGPILASAIQYTQPPATLIWAIFLLQEHITPDFVIGSILAYVGAFIISL